MAAGTLSKLSPAFVTAVTKPTWVVCVAGVWPFSFLPIASITAEDFEYLL